MVAKTKDAVTGKPVHGHWGGYDNDFGPSWWQIVMIITSPLLCYYIIAVGEKANWGVAVPSEMSLQGIWAMFPAWNWDAVPVVVAYIAFQVITYLIVPGEVVKGPVTPAGNIQTFKINSLACWFVNVFVFMVFGWHGKWFDVSWASRNVGALFHVGCIWGFAVSILSYVKGHFAPTNSDAAIRNDVVQDCTLLGLMLRILIIPQTIFTFFCLCSVCDASQFSWALSCRRASRGLPPRRCCTSWTSSC
jgi:hypothetical protein